MSNKVLITNDQNVVKVPSGLRILIRRSCNAVLDFEHFDGPAEISVTFVDNNRIHELNLEYRNKGSATDVLSFPMGENGEYDIDEDNGCKILGDIVISMERATEQAELYGHSLQREVAYLTVHEQADAGIVISASHNPFEHNGIKMFSAQGFKLSDELEAEIEALILQKGELPARTHGEIGRIYDGAQLMDVYLDHLASTVDGLQPIKVVFDCANGAASATAKKLFSRFPLQAEYLSVSPDGVNINENCGSTHLERLSRAVREGGFQLGLAFDGDADRCLAVDENGCEIDGDQIMAVCAEYLTAQGKLQSEGFVATVMSNLGLHKFCEQQHLKLLCAAVGDRNVLELMQKEHMVLGGEQSGHIIFLEHMTTGDGQLAALQFLSILGESGKTASELAGQITHYPQVLRNVKVGSNEEKTAILNSRELAQATAREEVRLTGRGRILLRASGTEPLIRVMAEADTQDLAESVVKTLVEAVENVQKILKK